MLCGNFLHCLPSAVYAHGNWRWHTTIDEFLQWSEKNGRTSFREKNRIDCSCRNGRCFLCHRDFSIKIYSGCFWNADGIPGLFWNRDGSQCGFIFVHRTGKVPYFLFECDTSGEKSNAAYLWRDNCRGTIFDFSITICFQNQWYLVITSGDTAHNALNI